MPRSDPASSRQAASTLTPTPTAYSMPTPAAPAQQPLTIGRLHPAVAAQQASTAAALAQPAQRARISATGVVQFVLDPDIRLACEDQAQAHSVSFEVWLQDAVNQALRSMLGV